MPDLVAELENTVTAGITSGLGRAIPGAARHAPALIDLIQTDAAISQGVIVSAHGPLADADLLALVSRRVG